MSLHPMLRESIDEAMACAQIEADQRAAGYATETAPEIDHPDTIPF